MAESKTPVLPASIDFSAEEAKVLRMWREIDAFQTSLTLNSQKKAFTFYDGPPFATGLPHYGHILAGTIKDTITRFQHMMGHHVERRFGWDCHGLPVEYEIDKKLGITGPDDITGPNGMGIRKYNEECRAIVSRYSNEWREIIERMGRWIDFDNDYKTMEPWYMESVWWVFKQVFEKGLVYQSYKVMPYSTACCTPLSNFEAQQNYKEGVIDPAVVITFPCLDGAHAGAEFLAWTTTPWTLPSNLALCVHPEIVYVKFKDLTGRYAKEGQDGRTFIMGKARLCQLYPKYGGKKYKGGEVEILEEFAGATLKGMTYEPLFPYFGDRAGKGSFKVCVDEYVTSEDGTCIVHQAPAFGEDDFRVCMANGVIVKGELVPCPLDAKGTFTDKCPEVQGQYIKDADAQLMEMLKARNRLVQKGNINHRYPFCWRSDTPLIYRIVPSWFIEVTKIRDDVVRNNQEGTTWVPKEIGTGRFHNWLSNARDWAVSRNRYWGTPIPIWVSDDGEEVVCVGSIDELKTLSGVDSIDDLHRENIDDIKIPSKQGRGQLSRVKVVFDCWFESGSMPYAQQHYPFVPEKKKQFEAGFPADFIAEGLDQTRGWFYTLMVLSTALFNKPAFKNLIVNGLVLAADGTKMSKRLKNYPPPMNVVDKCGADALRMYLVNSPVVRAQELKFSESGVRGVVRDMLQPWYSSLRMLSQNVARMNNNRGAGAPKFAPSCAQAEANSNFFDVWVRSELQKLVMAVRTEVGAYRLYTVLPNLVTFIGDLNNWYIRLNRARLKQGDGVSAEDAQGALSTLYSVLLTMCKILAPFTPFFTEYVFQQLRTMGDPRDFVNHAPGLTTVTKEGKTIDSSASVHFFPIPEVETIQGSEAVLAEVAYLQKIIECGRLARVQAKAVSDKLGNNKFPINKVLIVHGESQARASIEKVRAYVAAELNVQGGADGVEITGDEMTWCSFEAEPDNRAIGRRFKKERGQVLKGIKTLPHETLKEFETTKTLTLDVGGNEVVLTNEEVRVARNPKKTKGYVGIIVRKGRLADSKLAVFLSTEITEEAVKVMMAREMLSCVNRLRKAGGLVPEDKIRVFYDLSAGDARKDAGIVATAAVAENLEMLQGKLRAPVLPATAENKQEHMFELASEVLEMEGVQMTVSICRKGLLFANDATLGALFPEGEKRSVRVAAVRNYVATMGGGGVGQAESVAVNLDGVDVVMKRGEHFWLE
jgi:isoleucyl-tRNA synthetase